LLARFWRAYAACGLFSSRRDCFEAAGRAADLERELNSRQGLYEALILRAGLGARRLAFEEARAALAEADRIEDLEWSPVLRARRCFAEWILALREGRYADAREHALRQAELNRAGGYARGEQVALGNAAAADMHEGRLDEAISRLRGVIAELERLGAVHVAGHASLNLHYALLRRGDLEDALEEAQRAYVLLRREGDQASLIYSLAKLAAARGDQAAALRVAGYERKRLELEGLRARKPLVPEELAPDIAPGMRDALMAEGERLMEEEAIRLVLSGGAAHRPELQ